MKAATAVAIIVILAIALLASFFIGQNMQSPTSNLAPTESPPTESPPTETPNQTPTPIPTPNETPTEAEVKIEEISVESFIGTTVDETMLFVSLTTTKTQSKDLRAHYEITVESKQSTVEGGYYVPEGTASRFLETITLSREQGEYVYSLTVLLTTTSGEILSTKSINVNLPTITVGETIKIGNLDLTLISWRVSNIAVYGPYSTGYYTFTAKPDMKFIILFFNFQNNWNRELDTPYISAGEVLTDIGYIYELWSPPSGANSEEYNPERSTEEELTEYIGDRGGFETLLPEESVDGCVVFEVPNDSNPVEVTLSSFSSIIILQ